MLQAVAIGESGQVLVLDMGQPVKIFDLARDLIRLAGHTCRRRRDVHGAAMEPVSRPHPHWCQTLRFTKSV